MSIRAELVAEQNAAIAGYAVQDYFPDTATQAPPPLVRTLPATQLVTTFVQAVPLPSDDVPPPMPDDLFVAPVSYATPLQLPSQPDYVVSYPGGETQAAGDLEYLLGRAPTPDETAAAVRMGRDATYARFTKETTPLTPEPPPLVRTVSTLAPPQILTQQPMSLLKSIATLGAGFLAGGPAGVAAAGLSLAAGSSKPKPTGVLRGGSGAATIAGGIAGGVRGGIPGAIGGALPGLIQGLMNKPGSSGSPNATFFGGNCPPGRRLRRVSMGRDVCIKAPRMNPFNPRALARADRRVTAFARRATPILKDLGYHVSKTRKVTIKMGKRKRHR